MNDKLIRFINDTINELSLKEAEANYLKSCMQMVYTMGQRDQLEIDHQAELKRIDEIFKK